MRLLKISLFGGALARAAALLTPSQAQAGWGWHGGWGWGWRPGVVVAVPPVVVGAPVAYAPPAYGYYHWVPGHYAPNGYWVPAHWAY